MSVCVCLGHGEEVGKAGDGGVSMMSGQSDSQMPPQKHTSSLRGDGKRGFTAAFKHGNLLKSPFLCLEQSRPITHCLQRDKILKGGGGK